MNRIPVTLIYKVKICQKTTNFNLAGLGYKRLSNHDKWFCWVIIVPAYLLLNRFHKVDLDIFNLGRVCVINHICQRYQCIDFSTTNVRQIFEEIQRAQDTKLYLNVKHSCKDTKSRKNKLIQLVLQRVMNSKICKQTMDVTSKNSFTRWQSSSKSFLMSASINNQMLPDGYSPNISLHRI